MATFTKRRNGDGSTSWDAMVRVVGYPATGKSFRTKLAAELWAARTEAAAKGGTLASARGMTLGHLLDEALPRLTNPTAAVFAYWREQLGDVRLDKITPELIALHRDRLLGADCRGHNHKTAKPRSPATVRNYLIELSRLFALAVKETARHGHQPLRPRHEAEGVDRGRALALRRRADGAARRVQGVRLARPVSVRAVRAHDRRPKGRDRGAGMGQVDLQRRWATFPRTKNGDARGVPLTTAVCALLAARPRTDARVFPVDITKAWHTAVARAGIVNFRFHDLRHSCASALVQNGANLAEVATLLGHKGLAMTLRYSHVGNAGTSRLVDRVMGDMA